MELEFFVVLMKKKVVKEMNSVAQFTPLQCFSVTFSDNSDHIFCLVNTHFVF